MNLQDARKKLPELSGLSDESALNVIHQAYYPTMDKADLSKRLGVVAPEAPVPERSAMRAVGDTALALGQGVVGSFKSMSDVVGADNAVSRGLESAGEVLQDLKSDQSKAVAKNSQERIKAAEASGDTLEEAKAYMGMLWDQPGEMIAQGIGSFATMGFGKLAQGLKLARAAKASGVSKEAFLATDAGKQAIKEAADLGFRTNIGVGAAQGVGAVKGSQYEQTFNNARAQGMSEQDAAALATEAQSYGGPGTMQQVLGGGLGALAAGTGPIERMIAGKAKEGAVDGVATSVAKGFGKEFATEGTQGAQERYAGNTAAIDSGVLAPEAAMRGVIGQGLMEGTVGGLLGGGAGAFDRGSVADKIRTEDLVPEVGPMTRAANLATEVKAKQAEKEEALRLGFSPLAGTPVIFPDGSVALGSEQETSKRSEDNQNQNIQNLAETRSPMLAGDAARILEEAKSQGHDFTVAPHPEGGFLVVPRNWVTPQTAKEAEAELSGTIARMAQIDAAPVDRAPRIKSDGQELSLNTDPISHYINDLRAVNTPAAQLYVRDFDAGQITPQDVQQRIDAERTKTPDEILAQAAAQAPQPNTGLILNPQGQPFKTRRPADLAAKKSGGTVIEMPGGFAVQPAPAAPVVEPAPVTSQIVESKPLPVSDKPATPAVPAVPAGNAAITPEAGNPASTAPVQAPAVTPETAKPVVKVTAKPVDQLTKDEWSGLIGPVTGAARSDGPNEPISVDDAILLNKMVVKTIKDGVKTGKTREQIVSQVEGLTKGGISNSGMQRINEFLDAQTSPAPVTQPATSEAPEAGAGFTQSPQAVPDDDAQLLNSTKTSAEMEGDRVIDSKPKAAPAPAEAKKPEADPANVEATDTTEKPVDSAAKPEAATQFPPAPNEIALTRESIDDYIVSYIGLLSKQNIKLLEGHYGEKSSSKKFLGRVKEDVVAYATENIHKVSVVSRESIKAIHAGILSVAVIFNPTYISQAQAVIIPTQSVKTESKEVLADVPESAAIRMSNGAKEAYSFLYPSIKDQLLSKDKLMIIVDKPSARMFVFNPDGTLLIDKKILLGEAKGDLYKGNSDLPSNRITPAGLFTMGLRDANRGGYEIKTAGDYDFKKVFVLDKAIEGEYSVTLFHSVWTKEADANERLNALKNDSADDSRYSFGCINVDKETYSQLIGNNLSQMDGASLFIVPEKSSDTAEFLKGATAKNISFADGLTRTTFTPAKKDSITYINNFDASKPSALFGSMGRREEDESQQPATSGAPSQATTANVEATDTTEKPVDSAAKNEQIPPRSDADRWQELPVSEREVLAQKIGRKGPFATKLAENQWGKLTPSIQAKLREAMGPEVAKPEAESKEPKDEAEANEFVNAPDGGLDFGEITPEMGKAMRRQAGKIRLTQGVQNSDGTGHGLVHIEANHGAQIRKAGFKSVQDFVSHVASGFNEILQAAKGKQLLVAVTDGRRDVMFVQLDAADDGDFYRVNTAFPASRDYLEKQESKGAKVLWGGSEPRPVAAGQQPLYAGSPETSTGQDAPIAQGQSGVSVPAKPDSDKPTKIEDSDEELIKNRGKPPAFSRGQSFNGITKADAEDVVTSITDRWANAPEVVVVSDMQDAAVPDDVRTENAKQKSLGATGEPEGFFHGGKVYIVAGALRSPGAVMRVLFHESLGHYGLRGVFGKELTPILQQLVGLRRWEVIAKARDYGLVRKGADGKPSVDVEAATDAQVWAAMDMDHKLTAAEEVLAEMAQSKPEMGYVKRAIAAIRAFLRKNVPGFQKMALTDDDIISQFILPARKFVERGPGGGSRGGLSFSRSPMKSVDANIKRGLESLAKALDDRTTVHRAMFRNGLGWVDFVWGSEGTLKASGKTKGAMGIAHIVEARQRKDGLSDREVLTLLEGIVDAIASGSEISRSELESATRVGVESGDTVVWLTKQKGSNAWVVTAYEKNPDSANAGRATVAPTSPAASLTRDQRVAGFAEIIGFSDPDVNFSRSLTAPALAGQVRDKLNETFNHPGKLNWWHKTVGSQYDLAERNPAFKKVFDAAQNFINDVSYYATEAANMAPKILPKLETLRDLTKTAISAADNKAVAAPVFEGTLSWARDADGEPIRIEALEKRYENLTDDQKAQMLLRKNVVSEDQLKAWKASKLDVYSGAIRNRFESTFLKAGVRWTDAELKSIFKLTDDQVELYKEFRAATDTSLDNMAKAQMLREAGKDVADLRDMVMEAPDVDTAAKMLREVLLDLAKDDPDRADILTDAAAGVLETAAKINELKKQGYAPLSRFGRFTVDVVVDGKREYFGLFETEADSNKMAAKMRMSFGRENVAQGTMSQKEFELFQGITPESLELFGNMMGLDSTGNEAQDKAFQTYLKLTKNNRSAMKRLIHRQGIAGYSEDVGRVLAAFVYANARQTSAALHIGQMDEAITAIPKGEGELKDHALELAKYIKEPREEAAALRGLLFAQYLGGSVASAMVNFTQPLTVSIPYLSQFGGLAKAGKAWAQAVKDMSKGTKLEPGLERALKDAEESGVVSPQEVHQLMAQARGASTLQSGDGTKLGDAKAMAANGWTRTALAWGKLFGYAEQVNRRSTFIAAYRLAVDQKIPNPGAFAEKAVNETQFVNNKANKMKFGRGAIGATLMTFKSYSIHWLELMHRLSTQDGKDGKLAAAYMLGALFLMAGAGGLPFTEDVEDLIDAIGQKMGYNLITKKAKQEFLESVFGKAGAQFIDRGLTGLPGVPIDVSGRMGMSNLIPGTGLLLEKRDSSRDLMELAGPAGDMAKRFFEAVGLLAKGEVGKAVETAAPKAVGNMIKGVDMLDKGMYRDTKGAKVIDTTAGEAVAKMIGFQPASVSQVQESNYINQRAKDFYSLKTQEIRAKWAMGIFENNPEKVSEARQMMQDWNENNPDQRMTANMPAIVKKVREMRKDKAQRIADTAPKALRAQMREDAKELAKQ